MRSFARPKVALPTLASEGPGGKAAEAHRIEYKASGKTPKSAEFAEHWTKADVKGALFAMHGRLCAYCNGDISENQVDVEHFRPKANVAEEAGHGGYWWLAYEFSNYLLSCTKCNQRFKNDSFPLLPGKKKRVRYETRRRVMAEPRLLFDPATDRMEDWIEFDWRKEPYRLRACQSLSAAAQARVDEVIGLFGLNRKPPQVTRRIDILREVVDAVNENRAEAVKHYAIRFHPHSVVAHSVLREKAPHALPSGREEFEWLLDHLCREAVIALDNLGDHPSDAEKKEADEILWAIAILWKSPPYGTAAGVEQHLKNGNPAYKLILDPVRKRRDRL